jgi:hypothetical protein
MGKMEKVSVTDLYEACYLLLNGAELETVRCIPAGKNINCELVLCGGSLTDLMDEYYQKNAMVNLFSFRSVYSRVSSHIHNAKRSFKKGSWYDRVHHNPRGYHQQLGRGSVPFRA